MENKLGVGLDKEQLKRVAGGDATTDYYNCDWLIRCHSCKHEFVIHGFQQKVYCPACTAVIYLVHGEGNPHKIDPNAQ